MSVTCTRARRGEGKRPEQQNLMKMDDTRRRSRESPVQTVNIPGPPSFPNRSSNRSKFSTCERGMRSLFPRSLIPSTDPIRIKSESARSEAGTTRYRGNFYRRRRRRRKRMVECARFRITR